MWEIKLHIFCEHQLLRGGWWNIYHLAHIWFVELKGSKNSIWAAKNIPLCLAELSARQQSVKQWLITERISCSPFQSSCRMCNCFPQSFLLAQAVCCAEKPYFFLPLSSPLLPVHCPVFLSSEHFPRKPVLTSTLQLQIYLLYLSAPHFCCNCWFICLSLPLPWAHWIEASTVIALCTSNLQRSSQHKLGPQETNSLRNYNRKRRKLLQRLMEDLEKLWLRDFAEYRFAFLME